MRSRTRIPSVLDGGQIRTTARFSGASGPVRWSRQLFPPLNCTSQTTPMHHVRSSLFLPDCILARPRLYIISKRAPPRMHPLRVVVHGRLLACNRVSRIGMRFPPEQICKYSCRDRRALQFVSAAVRSHYTQAALPGQFTELCIQVLPSPESDRQTENEREGARETEQGERRKGSQY